MRRQLLVILSAACRVSNHLFVTLSEAQRSRTGLRSKTKPKDLTNSSLLFEERCPRCFQPFCFHPFDLIDRALLQFAEVRAAQKRRIA